MMDEKDPVPVSKILGAVSTQLDELGEQVTKLENNIGPIVAPNLDLPDEMIRELQSLDRIRQSMQDLARVTGKLSQSVGDSSLSRSQIEATSSKLQLSTSRSVLNGNQDQDVTDAPGPDAENLTLF